MSNIETNLQQAVKQLESMQVSGTQLEKTLQKLVKQVISSARKHMSEKARSVIEKDPRKAYLAVKSMVYRQVLGGNVSILNRRGRSVKMMAVPDPPKRTGRGGNRVKRSQRTTDLLSYYGTDRGFVLRFLNSGTSERIVKSLGGSDPGDVMERRTHGRRYKGGPYNRGAIAARNWFPNAGQKEMEIASEQLAQFIEREIEKFNSK